ncbi:MAG: hypothetical protein J6X44_06125 [Thermoguttaceae bacterium]|nr:hypothetical protein [Thermoguttaceae bacterium]
MKVRRLSRRTVVFTVVFLATATSIASELPSSFAAKRSTQSVWKFDFGDAGAETGYVAVDAETAYDASKGYGFADVSQVKNASASGKGALADAVEFTTVNKNNTFDVDLPQGLYQIDVALGNTTRSSIRAEGVIQIVNMTGNNAVDSFVIPIVDGRLNVMATEGKAGAAFTLSSLEITKLSDDVETPPTIWVCGDSTVCNYYPLDRSVQAGWAQMIGKYADSSKFMIRNMAAGGQFAKGILDAGLFDAIETYGKKGDYFIVSVGINDGKYSNADEYRAAVTDMTRRAKKKDMTVVLVKQQGRANDISRPELLKGRWFGGVLDEIGAAENVQVVDLFTLAQNYWLSVGQDEVYKLFMKGDTLHPNRAGADKLAELVASAIDFDASDAPTETADMLEDLFDEEKRWEANEREADFQERLEKGIEKGD